MDSRQPETSHFAMTGSWMCDWTDALIHSRRKRREQESLSAVIEASRQKTERLGRLKDELRRDAGRTKGLSLSRDISQKDNETKRTVVKVEKQRRELVGLEAELENLQEERTELEKRIEQQLRELQRYSLFHDFLQQVIQTTKFENVQAVTDCLENLLHTREHFSVRFSEADEQVNQQRKVLLMQEEQHRLTVLSRNNQLLQLQTELEKTFAEAESWDREWSRIQESATNETLLLGQIKMATLNLYELTYGVVEVGGDGAVAMSDTGSQLDKISIFIQDHDDIVKREKNCT